MINDITQRDYEKALECREYINDIIKRVQKRLDKYQEEHENGFADWSKKINKLEHELEVLERLKQPFCETISIYKDESRSDLTDEQLKEMWIKDNGPLPDDFKG